MRRIPFPLFEAFVRAAGEVAGLDNPTQDADGERIGDGDGDVGAGGRPVRTGGNSDVGRLQVEIWGGGDGGGLGRCAVVADEAADGRLACADASRVRDRDVVVVGDSELHDAEDECDEQWEHDGELDECLAVFVTDGRRARKDGTTPGQCPVTLPSWVTMLVNSPPTVEPKNGIAANAAITRNARSTAYSV